MGIAVFRPGGGGAPTDAQYVVLALDATLTGERVLTGSANEIVVTDGGAGGNVTLTAGSLIVQADQNNTWTTGVQTINTGAVGTVGLIVKANVGQTANRQEWQDSRGAIDLFVANDGALQPYNIRAAHTGVAPFNEFYTDIVSAWNFDEGAGTTAADKVGSNDLTLNSASWTASAKVGPFAATDYGSVANILATNAAWTIMGWVYSTNYASVTRGLCSVGNSPTDGTPAFILQSHASTLRMFCGGGYSAAGGSLTNSTWHNVAATFDGVNVYRCYLDGVEVASRTAAPSGNTNNTYIGVGFNGSLVGGRYDEWAYFDVALDAAAISRYILEDPIALTGNIHGYDPDAPANRMYLLTADTDEFYNASGTAMVTLDMTDAEDTMRIQGVTSNTVDGPLTIQYVSGGAGNIGIGFTLDATNATDGKQYAFIATGAGALGNGGDFAVYNSSDAQYIWRMDADGRMLVGINQTTYLAQLTVYPYQITEVGMVIQGVASQSASLFRLQDSTSGVVVDSGDGLAGSAFVFNEGGIDIDFRVESATYDAINVDAGDDELELMKNAAGKIGFFGATPVVQRPKASYNNWAAFTDVVDALVDLGLFDAA